MACPLGFGSGVVRASTLECGWCRGLLCDAVRIQPCGCGYCLGCVERVGRDCFRCGGDVEGVETGGPGSSSRFVRDESLDDQVELFLRVHGGDEGRNDSGRGGGKGMALMQHAVRHWKGGNDDAATRRMTAAMDALAENSPEEAAIAAVTLAEWRVSGPGEPGMETLDEAWKLFRTALRTLSEAGGKTRFPLTKSITHIKFGQFLQNSMFKNEEALVEFSQAVDDREEAVRLGTGDVVDVCTCLVHVIRVALDLGRRDVAISSKQRAVELLGHEGSLNLSPDRIASVRKELFRLVPDEGRM